MAQSPLSQGEHFADINGIKLHYYVSGSGPVCLFPTPGWGPSIDIYKSSLQPMEKYFTMVWYDTLISGKSTGPEDSTKYSSLDFLNDMEGLRIHLNQPKVWVAGHSMGGFQTLFYGINYPENLNGIITLAGYAGRDSLYHVEFKNMVMKRKGKPYFEKGYNLFYGLDTNQYSISEAMNYIFPFYFHDEQKIADFMKLGDPSLSDKADRYTTISRFGKEFLIPELHKINVPALIITGDDDFVCDKISQGDRIHQNIPNSELLTIKDAGHFMWVEQPDAFFEGLDTWLKKQKL